MPRLLVFSTLLSTVLVAQALPSFEELGSDCWTASKYDGALLEGVGQTDTVTSAWGCALLCQTHVDCEVWSFFDNGNNKNFNCFLYTSYSNSQKMPQKWTSGLKFCESEETEAPSTLDTEAPTTFDETNAPTAFDETDSPTTFDETDAPSASVETDAPTPWKTESPTSFEDTESPTPSEDTDAPTGFDETESPTAFETDAPTGFDETESPTPVDDTESPTLSEDTESPTAFETDAPTGFDETDSPTPIDDTESPTPSEETDAPTPSEDTESPTAFETDAPTGFDETESPTAFETDAPTGFDETDSPTPIDDTESPTPFEDTDAPTPSEDTESPTAFETDAPTGFDETESPTAFETDAPTGFDETDSPTPIEDTESPTLSEDTESPTAFETDAPTGFDETDSPTPFEDTASPTPFDETDSPTPIDDTESPTPFEDTESPTPSEDTDAPTGFDETESPTAFETDAPTGFDETDSPTPIDDTESPTPFEDTDAPTPSEDTESPTAFETDAPTGFDETDSPTPIDDTESPTPFEDTESPTAFETDAPTGFDETDSPIPFDPLMPTATPTMAPTLPCYTEGDRYKGGTTLAKLNGVKTPEACHEECLADELCEGFSWKAKKKSCELKAGAYKLKSGQNGYAAGSRNCIHNTVCLAQFVRYKSKAMAKVKNVEDALSCANECRERSKCMSWTYRSSKKFCALFSEVNESKKKEGQKAEYFSGIREGCNSVPTPQPTLATPAPVISCGPKVNDVLFVVDSSGSIDDSEWAHLKNFVRQLGSAFDVGNSDEQTRLGFVEYSTDVTRLWDFTSPYAVDGTAFQVHVDSAEATGKGTGTGPALIEAQDVFWETPTRLNLDRRVVIMLTDGNPNKNGGCKQAGYSPNPKACAAEAAEELRKGPDGQLGTDDDVYLVYVRIGDKIRTDVFGDVEDLQVNASPEGLSLIADEIVRDVCDIVA